MIVLKTSWRYLCNTSWRRLEDVLKTFLQDVLKTSWKRLEDVLKTSWKRLEDVLKTYGQDEYIGLDQDVLKTSSEDVRLRRTYSSWSRRLEDEDERRLHQDECLLGYGMKFTNKELSFLLQKCFKCFLKNL